LNNKNEIIQKMKKQLTLSFVTAVLLTACGQSTNNTAANAGSAAAPAQTTSKGKQLFADNCARCHAMKTDNLGPKLDGVFNRWSDSTQVADFVKNSSAVIQGGKNTYATALFHKWSDMPMPPFTNLKDEEIQQILTYIHSGVE